MYDRRYISYDRFKRWGRPKNSVKIGVNLGSAKKTPYVCLLSIVEGKEVLTVHTLKTRKDDIVMEVDNNIFYKLTFL